jgi:hypothetical protein
VQLSEDIAAANPRPAPRAHLQLPVIFAGKQGRAPANRGNPWEMHDALCADNLGPTLEQENLFPARLKIQDLFMEHVMARRRLWAAEIVDGRADHADARRRWGGLSRRERTR